MKQHHVSWRQSAERPLLAATLRGFFNRCPHCGRAPVFSRHFLVADACCAACGEAFHHHRADDLPAYLVILVVGHVVVGAFMGAEFVLALSPWQHLAIWVPVAIAASLALLRPVKGAVIALQWALRMHGFGGEEDRLESHPEI
jgi:uncharacterized protein (DUF983 family)